MATPRFSILSSLKRKLVLNQLGRLQAEAGYRGSSRDLLLDQAHWICQAL